MNESHSENAGDDFEIDLVADGPFINFMYKNDLWYRKFVRPENKNKTVYDLQQFFETRKGLGAPPLEERSNFSVKNPLFFMMEKYAEVYRKFTVCDIGAHFGRTSMETAAYVRGLKSEVAVFAFDAGIASNLTWRNFENNGFNEIRFHHAAVGSVDGHAIMYRQSGHAEDNSLLADSGTKSFPVRCVKLDTVLDKAGCFGPTVAKIDTQGAEPSVISGMSRLIASHPVTMLMEYTPFRMMKMMAPESLIKKLMETHVIFDVGAERDRLFEVTEPSSFTADVFKRTYTDVLIIPRSFPDLNSILNKIFADFNSQKL